MSKGLEGEALAEVLEGPAGMVLRIWRGTDSAALRDALAVSDQEFRDWLPGVLNDTRDIREFLEAVRGLFDSGRAFLFAITQAGDVVGQCSLHPLGGGGGLIGYWVRTDRTGHGIASSALVLLTDAALAHGYQRLELRCDEGNRRSASVARRAGYRHVRTVAVSGPRTLAQTGREMIWERLAPEP